MRVSRRLSPALGLLLALVALAPAAEVANAPAAALPRAVGPVAAPLEVGAGLAARLDAALSSVDLRATTGLSAKIGALTASFARSGAPEKRLILSALAQPPGAVTRALSAAGVPAASSRRLAAVVEKTQARAVKDPALAQALARAAQVSTLPAVKDAAQPAKLAKIHALVESVVSRWSSQGATAPAAAAPAAKRAPASRRSSPRPRSPRPVGKRAPAPPAAPAPAPSPAPLGKVGTVSFGAAVLPRVALPSQGDVIADLWKQAHDQGPALWQANYNFDDMDIAQSILDKAKAGQKQVLVGDYSNWFPDRMPEAKRTGKFTPRTPAMNLIINYVTHGGPNLDFYILKGLGDIGINHNKFSLFTGPHGTLLQSGSFNYTKTSQLNHWENVVFTDDAQRIKYYQDYFQWLTRRARRFSQNLQPQDPTFDPADPIPRPPAEGPALHGVPFPKVSYSPNGGTEDWLVKMFEGAQKTIHILMFSPFPTPKMSAAIEAAMKRGVEVIMVADEGQVANATPIVPLVHAGMRMYTIRGPDVVVQHQPPTEHSKQHEKVIIVDGRLADAGGAPLGLAKMGDSLNISMNALMHNFENTQFFDGAYVPFMQAHFDYVLSLASQLSQEALQKLEDKARRFADDHLAPAGPPVLAGSKA